MMGREVKKVYMIARELGLVTSKSQFSTIYCGRSQGYLRGCRDDDALTPDTLGLLAQRLAEKAQSLDSRGRRILGGIADEIRDKLAERLHLVLPKSREGIGLEEEASC